MFNIIKRSVNDRCLLHTLQTKSFSNFFNIERKCEKRYSPFNFKQVFIGSEKKVKVKVFKKKNIRTTFALNHTLCSATGLA